jgi:hypothetical protein
MTPATAVVLAGVGVFALLILIGLLDYRRICRADDRRKSIGMAKLQRGTDR